MWLEAETDVSGSGRKLLRERNEMLPKLHCCLLTACFPAPVALHGFTTVSEKKGAMASQLSDPLLALSFY